MSFLKLQDGKVICTEEGMQLPEVQIVFRRDKTSAGKSYFQDVITTIFYLFKPRGVYWNKCLKDRVELVNTDHILNKENKWDVLVKKVGVREMADKFISLSQTVNDRLEDALKSDSDELMTLLSEVPMSVKERIEVEAEIECEDKIKHKVLIARDVIIPNMKGKKDLYDMSLSLSKQLKEIQANIKLEEEERVKAETELRMFDSVKRNQEPEMKPAI